jgi:hypothetical protein
VSGRPPQLSPYRLLAGLVLPLAAYLLIRAAIGSATGAPAITEAFPAARLLVVGITRRRLEPVAVLATVTVAIALAAYALTGGDPLALKLPRGAVTAIVGLTFTLDGASQIALALTVPPRTFIADSTATRIVVLGKGTVWLARADGSVCPVSRRRPSPPLRAERHG